MPWKRDDVVLGKEPSGGLTLMDAMQKNKIEADRGWTHKVPAALKLKAGGKLTLVSLRTTWAT